MDSTMQLFDSVKEEEKTDGFMSVLPVSVIDISAQGKRKNEDHSNVSSRANYSPFPKEVVDLCYEMFLKESRTIFDPFAGWGERGDGAKKYGKRYVGFDVSETAIKKAKEVFDVDNVHCDSTLAEIPEFDGLITCPPYWNLEKYDSDSSLCRIKTFEKFIDLIKVVFGRAYNKASNGAIFCIVAGDWRSKGIYYDLEFQICNMFKDFYGATIVDKVVLSRKNVTKIKIMLPQCKRLGYTVKVHETLLVFRKNLSHNTD